MALHALAFCVGTRLLPDERQALGTAKPVSGWDFSPMRHHTDPALLVRREYPRTAVMTGSQRWGLLTSGSHIRGYDWGPEERLGKKSVGGEGTARFLTWSPGK